MIYIIDSNYDLTEVMELESDEQGALQLSSRKISGDPGEVTRSGRVSCDRA